MNRIPNNLLTDIQDIANLDIVPTMLNVLCSTIGLGVAAVARVTDEHWLACSVNYTIGFGLKPGDMLDVDKTLCNELKASTQPLVIPNIDNDLHYTNHIIPLIHGFKSYGSVPIFRKNGEYFGSLFAIDPQPKPMNTEAVSGMLSLFAQLISVHLSTNEQIRLSELQLNKDRDLMHWN